MHLRRSIFITFFSTNAATAIQFAVTLILSRLLTPSEIGIYSITLVFTGIVAVFRDFGISSYLQREKELTPSKISSALGLLLTTSWLLAAFIYLSSGYVAAYYEEPGIQKVLHILTISFVLVPFASFFYALFARSLAAGKQAIVNGISTIFYATTCITLAFLGYSYTSLAWANVVNIAVTIVCYLFLRSKDQHCIPAFKGWATPARFGAGAILGSLMNRIYLSVPDLVLGKLSGPHDVGLYSRANGLVGIFSQIADPTINYNALPYISKSFNKGESIVPILSKSTTYLTAFSWPFFIVTALFPTEIIKVLYGEQWITAAPIAVFLCIQAIIRNGYSLTIPALVAIGRPYLSSISSGLGLTMRIAAIFLLGARDAYSFAMAICIADCLSVIAPIWLMKSRLGYSFTIAMKSHWPSVKVNSAVFFSAILMKIFTSQELPPVITMALISTVVFLTWLTSLIYFKHPLCDELPSILSRILPPPVAKFITKLLALNSGEIK